MKLYKALRPMNAHRLIYNSLLAKDEWHEPLRAISHEWETLELQSVLEGIRDCALLPLTQKRYLENLAWAHNNGLKVRLVRGVKAFTGFANYYEEGDDYYVTAVARSVDMLGFPEQYLGYPECCQRFFAGCYPTVCDPIWQWATGPYSPIHNRVGVFSSPYADPTLRYANIRFAPHIPCHPQCPGSIKLGTAFESLMDHELRDRRHALLSAPHTWDCYRSMAIVTTGPFRLVIGSVQAAERYVVDVNVR